MPVAHLMMMFV